MTLQMPFDLNACLRDARTTVSPDQLFKLWADVCRLYQQRLISTYELAAVKEVIIPQMRVVSNLTNNDDECVVPGPVASPIYPQ
jgi:hypothetical protein